MSNSRPHRRFGTAHAVCIVACVAFATSPSLAALKQMYGWSAIAGDVPSLALDRTIACDPVRGVVVLFASNAGNRSTGTWEWDGLDWQLRSTSGPDFRRSPAMVYDAGNGVCVLFGGAMDSSGNAYSDTWIWNGQSWKRSKASGPPARYGHSMAYDSDRGVVVLFGGRVLENGRDKLFNDTWEWDGSSWQKVNAPGPVGRYSAHLAYDPEHQQTVLFGGYARDYLSDTWVWNGTKWTKMYVTGPAARLNGGMVWDSANSRCLLFGGRKRGGAYMSDVWDWNGSEWKLVDSGDGPASREMFGYCYDDLRQQMFIVGGFNDVDAFRDYWQFGAAGWSEWTLPKTPSPLSIWDLAFDQSRRVTVAHAADLAETWEWDGGTWTLMSSSSPATALALAYHATLGQVVGYSADEQTLYFWNGADWQSVATGSGPNRNGPIAFDVARGELVALGATATWIWDGESWSARNVVGPNRFSDYALAYDEQRGRVVCFGGVYDGQLYADTWEWDGDMWSRISESGPAARSNAAMTYDSDAGLVVLYGGATGDYDSDGETWTWDGLAWTLVSKVGGGARSSAGLSYDRARHRLVLFGGHVKRKLLPWDQLSDTWEHGWYDTFLGDADCDEQLSFSDVDAFVAAVHDDPLTYLAEGYADGCWRERFKWGDMNGDGLVNSGDVDKFIDELLDSIKNGDLVHEPPPSKGKK